MHWIVGSSLKFRLVVVAIAAAVMGLGIVQLRSAPVDVLPEFTPPYVEIQTEALGLSADEVEQLITAPLEADLLNGVEGVEIIRSQSLPGLSSIVLVFEPGTDVYKGRQLVQERLTQLGGAALPMISKPAVLIPPLSSSSRVLMVGLSSEELSPIEKSVIARWTIRPRLMGVPGVANVSIWGMRDQQLQVQVDPEQLRDQNIRLSQVISTAGNAQVYSPLSYLEASTPGTGGFIETPQQRMQVRNILETIANPDALGEVPVEGTGGRLRLADVAEVTVDHQPLIGDAIVNDGEGLMLVVEKLPGADTEEVTEGVEAALEQLSPGLAGMEADTSVFRSADFIEQMTENLTLAAIIAGLLAALVLAALLFQWRAVLVSVVVIPLSLVAAALALDLMGETFNAISFAGLALAVALVVDDAVVGTEAIARRMRHAAHGRSTAEMVFDASQAVRSPLTYATVIALLAMAPIAAMAGRPGEFFGPLAVAYAVAVVVAMVVALTVTPALSMLLFSRGKPARSRSPLLAGLASGYLRALGRFVARPMVAVVAAAVLVAVGLAVLPFFGTSLVPSFKDRHVLVHLDGDPGMSNPRMTEIATEVSSDLRNVDGVENVGAHVGRAIGGDQRVDVNSSEVWVTIDGDADYDATMDGINAAVDGVDEVRHEVVSYTTERIRDIGALDEGEDPVRGDGLDVLTGVDAPLVVRVYGQDLETLQGEAEKVHEAIADVDGLVDPRIEQAPMQDTLEIEVDLAAARALGIKPGDVRRAQTTLVQGLHVGSVFEEQKVFDVVVQGTAEMRSSVDAVRNLLIDRPDGEQVRLDEVADVRIGQTPVSINRDAVSRRVDIVAGVDGRSVDEVAADIENRIAGLSFPVEYHAEVLQSSTGDEIGTTRMLAVAIAALVALFLLLQAAFQSWRLAALAYLTLPVALVGGVLTALVAGAEWELGSAIGLIAVFALAARNGVLLVRHFQDLERDGERFGRGLVERGAADRLAPILTTAGALAVAALPLIILGGRPGLEIIGPMAVVLLGGLVTTTFVALFLMPALYLRFAAGAVRVPPPEERLDDRLGGVVSPEPAVATAGNGGGNGHGEREVHVTTAAVDDERKDEPGAREPRV